MKSTNSLLALSAVAAFGLVSDLPAAGVSSPLPKDACAQAVERPRPAGWDRLVPGGRFMDRFEAAAPIGALTSDCWGGENVRPRDVRNGIESADYSYWGGNIMAVDGQYHLFVARWKESEPEGHMHWPKSEIAHCVSVRPDGDFRVVEVLGKGHNPELFRCKDGSFAVYCINDRGKAHVYRAATVNGPWIYSRLELDLNGRKLVEGESNFSFAQRPDGSVLAVCRGGAIWLSSDGIRPFKMMTGRVYPNVAGRFEDPVLWRDEVQYHLIVNDWLGRVAWYLTSPDGFVWTTQPGEAYMPGIARVAGGVTNDWFKYERMRVTTDAYGRVFQANFAVIDCVKKKDRAGDIHSSKNITVPVNPGRRVHGFKKTRKGYEMRIAKEAGFDPRRDVDVESVVLGPQSFVAYGQGVRPIATDEADGDLVLVFPSVELDTPVVKALGREKSGRLFFATARTDGSTLGPVVPNRPTSEITFSATRPDSLRVTRGERVEKELVLTVRDEIPLVRTETDARIEVVNGALRAVYDKRTGLVTFYGADGRAILAEKEVGAKSVAFDSPKTERLYGLGQFQDGCLDIRNQPRRLTQVNTQVSVPFLVSTRQWGLYWNNYSKIDFNPCDTAIALTPAGEGKSEVVSITTGHGNATETRTNAETEGSFEVAEPGLYAFLLDCGQSMARRQVVTIDGKTVVSNRNRWLPPTVGFQVELAAGRHTVRVGGEKSDRPVLSFRSDRSETRFVSDVAKGADYSVYAGSPEKAIAAFRADCGGTAALPDWCWGYWHCQERFHDQKELLAAAHWFADRKIPVAVIVQDWHWWPDRTWNAMEWDSRRYPDPKGMVDECHGLGMRVMLSVWSKTSGKTAFRAEMEAANGLVPGTDWIDFSNPKAADIYWKWFAKNLMSTGMDSWWLDACEPENDDLAGRTIALGDGNEYRNVYPLLVNTEADRRQRTLRPGAQPLVLSRSGYAGLGRTATVVWSGDVGSDWRDFRTQVVAGLGLSMASLPYWTTDAGGFFRPGHQYTDKNYHKRFIRWVQFATFCPIMRLHGGKTDMTPSRFGPEVEKAIVDQIRLRERIRPYVEETARQVVAENGVMMMPLVDAPKGFETEYLFGKDLLVCPVTADVGEMNVWLPAGTWTDFHTGEEVTGDRTLRVKTPLDRIPVYRRK